MKVQLPRRISKTHLLHDNPRNVLYFSRSTTIPGRCRTALLVHAAKKAASHADRGKKGASTQREEQQKSSKGGVAQMQDFKRDETLLFQPVRPGKDALQVIYAYPNKYTVGITSLGYQLVSHQTYVALSLLLCCHSIPLKTKIPTLPPIAMDQVYPWMFFETVALPASPHPSSQNAI